MAAIEFVSTSLFSDANLVAYYKLEDVNDSKGARTLTNNSVVTFDAALFNNGAHCTFATSNFLSRAADNYGIAGSGDIGMSFWIKITAAPSSGVTYGLLIHRSQLTADRYLNLVYKNNAGTLQLIVDNSGNTQTYNIDLGTSVFHNIVLTRSGTSSFKLFVDGVDTIVTSSQGGSTAGSEGLNISSEGANGSSSLIDDFTVFSRVLIQADVNIIFGATGQFLSPNTKKW